VQCTPDAVFRERHELRRIECDADIDNEIMSGSVTSLVSNPIRISAPQTVSTTPTNGAMTAGEGMPIFAKRPTPSDAGKINF
jgi:hypothetical protein